MSCRHDLVTGTCKICNPATGTINPMHEEENLDDIGFLRPTKSESLPQREQTPFEVLANAIELLCKVSNGTRKPRFRIILTSQPSDWELSNDMQYDSLESTALGVANRIKQRIEEEVKKVSGEVDRLRRGQLQAEETLAKLTAIAKEFPEL